MINQDNNSIELTANSIEVVANSKDGTTSLKMEQLDNGDIKITQNKENKCEHIIGLWSDTDRDYNITLNKLKHEIQYNTKHREYVKKEFPREYELLYKKTKELSLKDYFDRRKNVNLERYNYCPICGAKIDWKKIKEENS